MKCLPIRVAWLCGLVLPAALYAGTPLEVEDAWIRAAPPTAQVLAGYLTLRNTGDRTLEITGARSPDFSGIEIHRTIEENGVARMVRLESIPLAPGARLRLEPGAMHLMLFDPEHPFRPGDTVRLELLYSGGSLPFEARVTGADSAGEHLDHQHH